MSRHPAKLRSLSFFGTAVVFAGCWLMATVPPALASEPSVVGTTEAIAIEAAHLRGGSQRLHREGATFLKPRFGELALRSGDRLVVRDGAGRTIEVLEGVGPRQGGAFWGLAVPGDTIELELRATRPYVRSPFRIDRWVVGSSEALAAGRAVSVEGASTPGGEVSRSLCGPGDFEDAFCYTGFGTKWGNLRATAGILAVGDDPGDDAIFCTGVNISPRNVVLTSTQCVADGAACQNSEFVFGYYRTGCGDGSPVAPWQGFRCGETVASSPFGTCEPAADALDVAAHTVLGEPTAEFGFVRIDTTPLVSGDALYLAQHAGARPLEVTHGSGTDVEIDGLTIRYFGTLDTEVASIGGPIFRESDDRLVGVHHCGGCPDLLVGNRGVPMTSIEPLIADLVCTDALELEGVGPPEVVEVLGNGDAVIDPGETWGFVPRVRNVACSTIANGVTATFAVAAGSAPVTLLDTVADFGMVAAASLGEATTPLHFQLATDVPCSGDVLLDLVEVDATGVGPFPGESSHLVAPVGSVAMAIPLFEDFAAGIPGDWTVVDGASQGGDASTWTTANPGARTLALAEPFAIADSDAFGPGDTMDEELITPVLDVSDASAVTLRFDHIFEHLAGGGDEQGDVDVRSTATGGVWSNVANFSGGDAEGAVEIDLSSQAGVADLQVRFHYYQADFDFYWAVDDVTVTTQGDATCRVFDPLFTDGFESGDTSAWDDVMP